MSKHGGSGGSIPCRCNKFLHRPHEPISIKYLLFVVNSPNIVFQVFFKPTQCQNTFFDDFCFKIWLEKGVLNIFF